MNLNTLGNLVTVCLFGWAGWSVAQRTRVPVAARAWVLLIVAAVLRLHIRFWLVSVFGLTIRSNRAIMFCCLGVMAGLAVRSVARRHAAGSGA